jgi:hypothetical protein
VLTLPSSRARCLNEIVVDGAFLLKAQAEKGEADHEVTDHDWQIDTRVISRAVAHRPTPRCWYDDRRFLDAGPADGNIVACDHA